ncbi:MAG TPA: multicopper oxidase domain-containing protein [Chryseolinea sp.]|nr:multicopper oxidase domain-containing protein [Chryseolinea sp.]
MKYLLFILWCPLRAQFPIRAFRFLLPLIVAAAFAVILVNKISQCSPGILKLSLRDEEARRQDQVISCAPQIGNYFYPGLESIEPNDNRRPAGLLKNGVLAITLEAREGVWYPETPVNPGIPVYAFAEEGKPLQLPGPLIRVQEGTEIELTVKNNIAGKPLNLLGFHARPGEAGDSVTVEAGATWITRFKTGGAGTYYYRGTMDGVRAGGWPIGKDGQLYGGFIVDKAGTKPDTAERIFMVGRTIERLPNVPERVAVAINGLSWPFTERLNYKVGEPVNWRVINASSIAHPMHLHGFYYDVHSIGDREKDKHYAKEDTRRVVTQLLLIGQTMRMSWIPERSGNWLFHCHMLKHIAPESVRLRPTLDSTHDAHHLQHHMQEGMAGLIMGIHVLPNKAMPEKRPAAIANRRQIDLLVKEYPSPFKSIHTYNGLGFILQENKKVAATPIPSMPGPPVIIHQGEPVAIKVSNQSGESTTIHWHGIELENYFDGVAGWGFQGTQVSPLIEPGQSFTAQITAPHAGTFMYHTHMHDNQLMRGMYGPLIVLKPGEKFDSLTDKVIVMSNVRRFKSISDITYLINGTTNPASLLLKKGKKCRLRLINITEDGAGLEVVLRFNESPVIWKALAKDGLDLPAHQSVLEAAGGQRISVGETMDFEFLPKQRGEYKFEVYNHNASSNTKIGEMRILVR